MDLKEVLTIASWPVTFLLGIISGGVVVPKLTRKRQILTWAVLNEAELIPATLSKELGIPITIQVGNAQPSSLSALNVRLGNSGNEVIKDQTLVVSINEGASILNVRFSSVLGEYENHVKWISDKKTCRITADFINPSQFFDLEILSSDYEAGTLEVDASAPGVEVRRTSTRGWEGGGIPLLFLKGFKATIPFTGIGYDAGSAAMSEVAGEIKALRQYLSRQTP